MNQITADRLCELVSDALERTAFVLVDPADEGNSESFTPARRSRLQLTAPDWTGSITLTADDEFLRELASSLLGVDEDDVDIVEHGEDVLRELANIVAGSVSLAMGGDKTHIAMGLPAIIDLSTPISDADADAMLEGDCGFLNVQWSITSSEKAAA
ncbi:MAG: chemotaxis protein CheX [Phycisphaerales bacterium]